VLDKNALLVITGVFLLSMGSSAMNQIQERKTDALMERTERRPIPAGIISLRHAIALAFLFLLFGSLLLLATRSLLAAGIGLFTAGWYNLVYTPLKRVTAFAVLPGALIGALPPMIGWTAAGGYLLDTEILIVAMFLFIGQMPHYWLLMVKVGEEFKQAGMPAITSILSLRQIRNISFVWIAAMAVMVFSFPAWSLIETKLLAWGMVSGAVLFLFIMFRIIFTGTPENDWKKAFITVNLFYLAIILALIADKILKTNNY
jgi:protoheme IX farnesyltransferase